MSKACRPVRELDLFRRLGRQLRMTQSQQLRRVKLHRLDLGSAPPRGRWNLIGAALLTELNLLLEGVIDATTAFGNLDLDLHYAPTPSQAVALRTTSAARAQVTNLMATLLTRHPELREAFTGFGFMRIRTK